MMQKKSFSWHLQDLCAALQNVQQRQHIPFAGGQSCDISGGQLFPPCQPESSWASGAARTNLSLGAPLQAFPLSTDSLLPPSNRNYVLI